MIYVQGFLLHQPVQKSNWIAAFLDMRLQDNLLDLDRKAYTTEPCPNDMVSFYRLLGLKKILDLLAINEEADQN